MNLCANAMLSKSLLLFCSYHENFKYNVSFSCRPLNCVLICNIIIFSVCAFWFAAWYLLPLHIRIYSFSPNNLPGITSFIISPQNYSKLRIVDRFVEFVNIVVFLYMHLYFVNHPCIFYIFRKSNQIYY